MFIASHCIPKNRPGAKKESHNYYLGYFHIEVCRKTFLDTLGITEARLKSINNRRDKSTGEIKPDMRGKRE